MYPQCQHGDSQQCIPSTIRGGAGRPALAFFALRCTALPFRPYPGCSVLSPSRLLTAMVYPHRCTALPRVSIEYPQCIPWAFRFAPCSITVPNCTTLPITTLGTLRYAPCRYYIILIDRILSQCPTHNYFYVYLCTTTLNYHGVYVRSHFVSLSIYLCTVHGDTTGRRGHYLRSRFASLRPCRSPACHSRTTSVTVAKLLILLGVTLQTKLQ